MTKSSPIKKSGKITYKASIEGLDRANQALKRLGKTKTNFANSTILSRSTITKFFQRQPLQIDSFKKICEDLKLSNWEEIVDWGEIAELPELKSNKAIKNNCSSSDTDDKVESVKTLRRQVSVIDKQKQTIKAVIDLEGDINSINNDLKATFEFIAQQFPGDPIKVTAIKEGSIKLFIEGSPESIQWLETQIESGQLTTIGGFPVKGIQVLSKSSEEDESTEPDEKWRLVQEIVSQAVKDRNLSGVDLSDANLRDANLRGADLSDADLSDADLSDADLSDADLSNADLRGADLSGVNLRGADLSGADLSGVNLSGVNLSGVNLSGVNLSGVNLSGADLSGADLSDDNLSGVNLIYANLSDANLSDANLRGANLSRTYLRSADLRSANLRGADLSGADLSDANLSRTYLRSADLRSADLRSADLSDADLSGADLSGVNLNRAIVANALFGGSIGLTKDMRHDLESRGAIFGDRPPVLSPR
ncbi:pentapeptide repeat protein (plasmid) [Calothrix brevissima NIES-22]|nr:pentapeptide repeat protein [Calothrix brevissima NIES-22]